MTRTLVIIDSAHLSEAILLLQAPPLEYSAELAESIFVPAGSPTGEKPATKHWLSGELIDEHFQACQFLAKNLDWANVWSYNLEAQPDFPIQRLMEFGVIPLVSDV